MSLKSYSARLQNPFILSLEGSSVSPDSLSYASIHCREPVPKPSLQNELHNLQISPGEVKEGVEEQLFSPQTNTVSHFVISCKSKTVLRETKLHHKCFCLICNKHNQYVLHVYTRFEVNHSVPSYH